MSTLVTPQGAELNDTHLCVHTHHTHTCTHTTHTCTHTTHTQHTHTHNTHICSFLPKTFVQSSLPQGCGKDSLKLYSARDMFFTFIKKEQVSHQMLCHASKITEGGYSQTGEGGSSDDQLGEVTNGERGVTNGDRGRGDQWGGDK